MGGVMHCFADDWAMAQRSMDPNFHISFSGIVTFNNAEEPREVAKMCPEERILVETDAPYLTPVPHRGKPNVPGFSRHVSASPSNVASAGRRWRSGPPRTSSP